MTIALPSTNLILDAPRSTELTRRIGNLGDGFRRLARGGINNRRARFTITYAVMIYSEAKTLHDTIEDTDGVETITWTPFGESVSRNFYMDSVAIATSDQINGQVTVALVEKFI